jgi:glutamate--cysteine ligase catalytic subunit
MGLLSVGTPLRWEEAKEYSREVRRRGIDQFIRTYERLRDRPQDELKWGDEVSIYLH